MSSNTERLRGTFYLRTGAGSEDKTALYLMGREQGTGPLNGPQLFYRIHYYGGYHLSVAAGRWAVSAPGVVRLRGVAAIIFTDERDPNDVAVEGLFTYLRLAPFAEDCPLQSRPNLTFEEINSWGAEQIPAEWAVLSWSDALNRAHLILAEALTVGQLPPDIAPPGGLRRSERGGGEGDDDDLETRALDRVRHGWCDERLNSGTKFAMLTGLIYGFLLGGCSALFIARNVGTGRADDIFVMVFLFVPLSIGLGLWLLRKARGTHRADS